uniref:Uncharacterized protein n=1 Tax=Physcomitrium patens TaxID=3218 RepID=A0A2K1K4P0_PHYPA|nr:hypothetical protein PHYPA_025531 [Physcomitrium patens]PNR48738.1 hypothetical protein PHYPA_013215 [Physcomitrium patens]
MGFDFCHTRLFEIFEKSIGFV